MRIAFDVSQTAYVNTGVSNFLLNLLKALTQNENHEYILFFSSLRSPMPQALKEIGMRKNVTIKRHYFPPSLLDLLWNRLHIIKIENFIGNVDIFVSSDWVEPPSDCKKATIIYDLIAFLYPEETHNKTQFVSSGNISSNIVSTQRRKLKWVKKESQKIITISKSSKEDIQKLLNIEGNKISVVYPGI